MCVCVYVYVHKVYKIIQSTRIKFPNDKTVFQEHPACKTGEKSGEYLPSVWGARGSLRLTYWLNRTMSDEATRSGEREVDDLIRCQLIHVATHIHVHVSAA